MVRLHICAPLPHLCILAYSNVRTLGAGAGGGGVLRMVFPNDGVGVVITSAEGYDLVKIKPTESEGGYRSASDSVAYDLD